MSIHYLIDPFTVTGEIVDVVMSETGQVEATGSTVIRIPDGVAIRGNPTNLTDLLTAKYNGLMSFYAGFTDMLADPCMDESNFDLAALYTQFFLVSSKFVNHCLLYPGTCVSVPFPLGFIPTQCIVVWEEYTFTDSDNIVDRFQRIYTEESGANLSCQISFNGGGSYSLDMINGGVYNIPVIDQGNSFIIWFKNWVAGKRIYLGSWALLYL
jgi:hypothetical protein